MGKQILVIDDEELIVKTMSKLLEKNGFDVVIVRSKQDAVGVIEEEDFDLIISDMRMPGTTGVEIIKEVYQVLKNRNAPNPPVIFITGYADKDLEAQAKALDPIDYIYKPFDILTLVERINEVLK